MVSCGKLAATSRSNPDGAAVTVVQRDLCTVQSSSVPSETQHVEHRDLIGAEALKQPDLDALLRKSRSCNLGRFSLACPAQDLLCYGIQRCLYHFLG